MDKNFLVVDYDTPISSVSSLAMSRTNDKLYDFIVVTEKGKYIGTVTIKDLLMKITEIEVDNAKQVNPLSGLPGNSIVEQKLNACLKSNNDYSIAYIDIDNFKAYNDVYGFQNGDLVLRMLADLLKDSIPKENFIGHIGGDDFIVIMDGLVEEDYFVILEKQFESNVLTYYHPKDIENGFIVTANRKGDIEQFPLLMLTAVTIDNHVQEFQDIYEPTILLAKYKKEKKRSKSKIVDNNLSC